MQKTKSPILLQQATQKSTGSWVIALKASAIIIAVLLTYHQDLSIILNSALQDESASHILIIPFLFAYLVYRKRKMIRATISFEASEQPKNTKHLATLSGILLCIVATLLYWYGGSTFSALEYHAITIPIFISGLILILFNSQTLRQLVFPMAFLAFLTPPPSQILFGFGSTLSVISSEASSAIVNALGIHSIISSDYGNPVIILTRPDQTTMGFMVDIACSGIYSLMGFLVFAAFMAYIIRDKMWKKTTIFLIGLPIIYLFNITRLSIILLIGYQYGEQLALQIFHLVGGWTLIFLGTLLLLTISEKILKTKVFTKPQTVAICPECSSNLMDPMQNFCPNCGRLKNNPKISLKKQDIAKIAIITSAVLLLLLIQVPVYALTKGPAQIIITTPQGEQGNTQLLPQIRGYNLEFVYRDRQFEQKAGQDASLIYLYNPLDSTKYPIFIGIEIASAQSSLHKWEVCLITSPQTHGYQPSVTQLDLRDIQIFQNPPITARYFAFQYIKYNNTEVVLYWYETSSFTMNNTAQQRTVKISIVVYPKSQQEVPAIEEQLLPVAKEIVNYWTPMKTWSLVALILSQYGDKLTIVASSLLAIPVIFATYEKRKEGGKNSIFYQKLSLTDRQMIDKMIDTVQLTKKTNTPTLWNIYLEYQKTMNNNIEKEEMLNTLVDAEKTGLVSGQIVNWQDEPIQVWKANINRHIKNT
jgi:exosortase